MIAKTFKLNLDQIEKTLANIKEMSQTEAHALQ